MATVQAGGGGASCTTPNSTEKDRKYEELEADRERGQLWFPGGGAYGGGGVIHSKTTVQKYIQKAATCTPPTDWARQKEP